MHDPFLVAKSFKIKYNIELYNHKEGSFHGENILSQHAQGA